MQESIVRRLSFRSAIAMGEAGVERHMLGLLGSGCSARARAAGAQEWATRAWLAFAHTKHSPGGEVSLPGPAGAAP